MRHFLILFVILFNTIFGETEKLPNEQLSSENSPLKVFLYKLMEDSEGGYVFFNHKPVCLDGFNSKDSFNVINDHHKTAVALKEGARVWKNLQKENSDVVIHICKEDGFLPCYNRLLVINIPLFHRVVNENLSLFQYVLGPEVTSQKLLNALIHEDQSFRFLLNNDDTLIGILLGFGTQNSLYGGRLESIYLVTEENPPFLSSNLIRKEFNNEYLPIPPSFGFKTNTEEVENTFNKCTLSSPKLSQKKPCFFFGGLKNDAYNEKLVSDLEKTQDQIQELLGSKNFEKLVLKKLTGKASHDLLNTPDTTEIKTDKIDKVIAKGIWETLSDDDLDNLTYFLEGIDDPSFKEPKNEGLFLSPYHLCDFKEGKENLEIANTFFQSLDKDKDFLCIEPLKLYYKTLEANEKYKNASQGSLVALTYSVYSPIGHCLGFGFNKTINLKNTIPGFAHGVYGMRLGETRELFIHPSLAYGFNSHSLDKCTYLKAIVKLHSVLNQEPLPEIKSINLDNLSDPEVLKTYEASYRNQLRASGARLSSHLAKSKEVNLSKVKDYLIKFSRKEEEFTETTSAEQDMINSIHWNIYFKN